MPIYNIYFDICAIILTIGTSCLMLMRYDSRRLQCKIFIALLLAEFLTEVSDIASGLLMAQISQQNLLANKLLLYAYFLFHMFIAPLLSLYILTSLGAQRRHTWRFALALGIPCFLGIIAIALNPIFDWIFFFDKNLDYRHGPLLFLIYLCSFFYIGLILAYIIRHRTSVPNLKIAYFVTFIVIVLLSLIVQIMFANLLIILFIEATITLCLLVILENNGEIYNSMTSVYNRRVFLFENLTALRNNYSYNIIIVKFLNERYYMSVFGYLFMQNVMRDIAEFLVSITNTSSVFDCENGNFAIILYDKAKDKSSYIIDMIHKKFSQDWMQKEISLEFEAQICLVNVPEDIKSLEDIISLVDSSGIKTNNRVTILKQDHLQFLQRKSAVENAIEKALQEGSFKVYFQPIWDCKANKIHSAEALVRLIDEKLGFIPPDEFIPIAEKNGTITAIGQFVFEESCRTYAREKLSSMGLSFIEVNLSTVQCMHKNLPIVFKNTLEQYGLGTKSINLEITESAAINSKDTFHQTIKDLRNLGFTFSLDDYGTGYSNASYIFDMDFEIIKIDKSILWEAEKKASAKIILQNTVRMIKEMKMKILVEGVETEEQKNLVAGLGCDYCQGYYFSKPVPAKEFIEYVRKFNSSHP